MLNLKETAPFCGIKGRSGMSKAFAAVVVGVGFVILAGGANAASHREAPFITEQPKVDGTDFYMFRSYETGREAFVTMVADYMPLQDAYGGPNYFALDSNGLYEIHIDNNGDAKEDITFQFRFTNTLANVALPIGTKQVAIPLIQAGQVTAGDSSKLNLTQTYTVDVVRGNRRSARSAITNADGGGTTFTKPVDNIGLKTLPNYDAYAAQYLYTINIPGCATPGRMFVGQRKDPFVVALGRTFDLIALNPLGANNANVDDLADKNVTALALEVPIACLTAGSEPVIGGWTTASLRQGRLLIPNAEAGYNKAQKAGVAWTQVSRLGMPLVNEVVIGLKDKDKFNGSKPKNDAQFLDYVTNPTLPALIQVLFGAPAPTNFPRGDLVATFLTGIKGLNQPANVTPSEMLRLNTSIAPTAAAQNNLGVLGNDLAGYPNGRRPGDDVVDISLRVAMGVLCTLNQPAVFGCVPADAPAGSAPLTDGAYVDSSFFNQTFPYLKTPKPGSLN